MVGLRLGPLIVGLDLFDLIPLAITVILIIRKNPHPRGSQEWLSLRLCRVGLALALWSAGMGLVCYAFALVAFILGIIGITKGRTGYGVAVIVLSVVLPLVGTLYDIYVWL